MILTLIARMAGLPTLPTFDVSEPTPATTASPEADPWCPRCRIHRVRQDAYTGQPTFVPLCPVCQDEPPEECDACPELVNPDARCTHGRSLCPECLTRCPECRDAFADDGRLTR